MEQGTITERGQKTRRRIVGHATLLMYEKGYSNTTIRDVMDAAGVTKGSFYFHFASKEDLGLAVIENAASVVLERLRISTGRRDLAPIQRMGLMFDDLESIIGEADCARGCILGNLSLEMSGIHDGFRRRLARAFDDWTELLAGLLEEMKNSGDLPLEFDCLKQARFLVSAIEGGIMMSKVTLSPEPMRNCAALAMKQLASLISDKGATGQGGQTK